MRISKDKLGEVARATLETLREQGVRDIRDLSAKIDLPQARISVGDREFIEFSRTPSNPLGSGSAETISYIMSGTPENLNAGVVLEAKMNIEEDYTSIVVKCGEGLRDSYERFGTDFFGNAVCEKKFRGYDLARVREELEKLGKK
jgi:hypothetical protein